MLHCSIRLKGKTVATPHLRSTSPRPWERRVTRPLDVRRWPATSSGSPGGRLRKLRTTAWRNSDLHCDVPVPCDRQSCRSRPAAPMTMRTSSGPALSSFQAWLPISMSPYQPTAAGRRGRAAGRAGGRRPRRRSARRHHAAPGRPSCRARPRRTATCAAAARGCRRSRCPRRTAPAHRRPPVAAVISLTSSRRPQYAGCDRRTRCAAAGRATTRTASRRPPSWR